MGVKTQCSGPLPFFVLVSIDYRTNSQWLFANSGLSIYLLWFSSSQRHVILSVTKSY